MWWTTVPYDYKGRAGVNPGAGVNAVGQTATDGSGSVPAGYMGSAAYLYKQSGSSWALCKSASVLYNSSSTWLFNRFTSGACGSGNYRAGGQSQTYRLSSGVYDVKTHQLSPAQAGS